ncbi:MAG: rhodanese-like domain-containing protein [Pirellulaceae bacterium]|nr:rhodanese-like domain-containing protein [Pirellulaceae bacterium]
MTRFATPGIIHPVARTAGRLLATAVVGLGLCQSILAAEHTMDSLETVQRNLEEGKAVLVDVRELAETNAGYVREARLLPLSEMTRADDPAAARRAIAKAIPRDKILYPYCRSGKRCLAATDVLRELGYDARALKHGFPDLIKAGFPAAKP